MKFCWFLLWVFHQWYIVDKWTFFSVVSSIYMPYFFRNEIFSLILNYLMKKQGEDKNLIRFFQKMVELLLFFCRSLVSMESEASRIRIFLHWFQKKLIFLKSLHICQRLWNFHLWCWHIQKCKDFKKHTFFISNAETF